MLPLSQTANINLDANVCAAAAKNITDHCIPNARKYRSMSHNVSEGGKVIVDSHQVSDQHQNAVVSTSIGHLKLYAELRQTYGAVDGRRR